jgi:hypothetical protein
MLSGVARDPVWTVKRATRSPSGTGAFEPAVARREGMSDRDTAIAIRDLDATVHPATESS